MKSPYRSKLKDPQYVDVKDPQELLLQAQRLGRTPQQVAFAVSQVGSNLDAVAAFLKV